MNCRSRGWFLGDLELNIRSKGNTSCHVATSRLHHDFCTNIIKCKGRPNFGGIEERTDESTEIRVATSQCRNAWSTEENQQATQCRKVTTSRRHHDFCTNIIKCKGRPNFGGIEERMDESMESRAAATGIIGEDTSFCISSFLQTKLLMISRLIMCILKSSML